jgi:hypothetical protein
MTTAKFLRASHPYGRIHIRPPHTGRVLCGDMVQGPPIYPYYRPEGHPVESVDVDGTRYERTLCVRCKETLEALVALNEQLRSHAP